MPEQWIISVQGKEYGPANLQTLREWKGEGRVLAENQARRPDVDVWITAGEIPGLFEKPAPPPVQRAEAAPMPRRSFATILTETFRIYLKGFVQFFCLSLLVILPSVCAQLTSAGLAASPNADVDLRRLLAAGFTFCMLLLSLAFWPIFISGIQILTAELAAGRRVGFLGVLNAAVKFWPRVALLCLFVYGAYFFWTVLPIAIILILAVSGPSVTLFFLALLVLAFQVWIIGRLFVNFIFWQQCAVLDGSDVGGSLRESKQLARSGRDQPWFRRPLWRGVFLASLWFSFVLAIYLTAEWGSIQQYFEKLINTQDPQALLEALRSSSKAREFNLSTYGVGLLQAVLRPLLGIAFVLLYFDAKDSAGGS